LVRPTSLAANENPLLHLELTSVYEISGVASISQRAYKVVDPIPSRENVLGSGTGDGASESLICGIVTDPLPCPVEVEKSAKIVPVFSEPPAPPP